MLSGERKTQSKMTSVISSAEIITSYEKRVLYFFVSVEVDSETKKSSQSMSRNDFSLPGIFIHFDRS